MTTESTSLAVSAVVALAAATGPLLAPSAAAAQDGSAGAEEAGWLGVGLRHSVRCRSRVEARPDGTVARSGDSGCTRAFVAEAVVEDAPAERAGVEPGDTLVAVNGRALTRRSGRTEFGTLEPGRPAQLLLGRPGEGRVSLRVVPEVRPPEVPASRVRVADAPPAPAAPGDISPDAFDAADAAPTDARLDESPAAPGEVVFGRDEDGRISVRWGDGDSVVPSRLEEMAPRLKAIRDSVFARARRQMKALREHQRRALERARAAAEERARRAGADAPSGPGRAPGFPLGPESVRAAGAEFRPLAPSLADYFPGAERGLLVMEVVAGTPADELGLRPGDVVVEAGGRRVGGAADLRDALEDFPRRDSLVVKWVRKGEETAGVLRRR